MATIRRFEDLLIWQKSRELCKMVYVFIKTTRLDKDFDLKEQIKSSSGSIMDNIAEGFDRGGRKEFIQFLGIAKGSAGECKSQLYRIYDQNYISKQDFEKAYNLAEEVNKMIGGFIEYLNSSPIKGVKFKNRVEEPYEIYKKSQN